MDFETLDSKIARGLTHSSTETSGTLLLKQMRKTRLKNDINGYSLDVGVHT